MRSSSLLVLLAVAGVSCRPAGPFKSEFPNRPITIMAPANPGGGWDQTARLIQQVLVSEKIAPVPVEVVNRAGAGGTIGLAEFATANRNDPHTIMVLGRVMLGAILTNQSAVTLNDTIPLARLLDEYEAIAVPADSRYKTLHELIEDFRKDPQRVSWGGGSAGGTDHILVAMLAQATGVNPRNINYIAHSGGGEAAVAVMGGHVTAGVSGFGEWRPHVQSGRLRYLAVSSEKRVTGDSTPTLKENGIDIVLSNWRSVAAPAGTDPAARQWLVSALQKMRDSPAWRDILRRNYWQDSFLAGPEFEKYLADETANNAAMLRAMGLVPGTSLFPLVVGLGLFLSAAWILIGRRLRKVVVGELHWRGFFQSAGLLLAYIVLLELLGYILATTALIFFTARILESRRWLRDLAVGAAIAGAAYIVFGTVLHEGLPRGWLPF